MATRSTEFITWTKKPFTQNFTIMHHNSLLGERVFK